MDTILVTIRIYLVSALPCGSVSYMHNRRIDHYLHMVSKQAIDLLVKEEIGMLVIGKDDEQYSFGGKRMKRRLYRSSNGRLINADINGAGNIIRKVAPDAFQQAGGRVEGGKG